MTLYEYLATPETVLPHELVYGAVRVADAPLVSHQRAVLRFAMALAACASEQDAGEVLIAPVDVILDADAPLVVQPDVLFVARDRGHVVLDRIYGAPDLVLEVLSSHPRIGELDERVRWFATYGVREIWLYHQRPAQLDILTCRHGTVASRQSFGPHEPVPSMVLPAFRATTASILSAEHSSVIY